jgi:hypothetical protein
MRGYQSSKPPIVGSIMLGLLLKQKVHLYSTFALKKGSIVAIRTLLCPVSYKQQECILCIAYAASIYKEVGSLLWKSYYGHS